TFDDLYMQGINYGITIRWERGAGTVEDPRIIYTADEFLAIGLGDIPGDTNDMVYYKLANDLTFPETEDGYDQIYLASIPICFDGQGYSLIGYQSGQSGIFQTVGSGSVFRDLTVRNADILGTSSAAGGNVSASGILVDEVYGDHIYAGDLTLENVKVLNS